jgi:2-polyprenyl-3-methyl-5-hydroxy-6-metoxy-1,4-benzoquinol methylase
MERIKRYIPGGSFGGKVLVDVGCDTGELLDQARRLYGVRPIGIDVSRAAVKQAAAKGIETYCGQLDKAPPTLRDIPFMTAIDLIEHLADPGQFLEEVKKRLGNEGLLYLEMPNRASWVYRTGGGLSHLTDGQPKALFERLFPAEHLQYFSPEGFREWSQNRGFRVLDLRTLSLPASDIAVSWPILAGLSVLQGLDRLSGRGCRILISAVLKNESGS